ncbi:MAG: hypothetical protein RL653_1879 [Pseudomonadota bacterium]|jgi:hypothetical protein
MDTAWDVIDGILKTLAPGPETRGWRCRRQGACRLGADDPAWEGRPFCELEGDTGAYIRLAATVEWDSGRLHLTRQDEKTGGGDATWDIPLDASTLTALRKASWPGPGERPWF